VSSGTRHAGAGPARQRQLPAAVRAVGSVWRGGAENRPRGVYAPACACVQARARAYTRGTGAAHSQCSWSPLLAPETLQETKAQAAASDPSNEHDEGQPDELEPASLRDTLVSETETAVGWPGRGTREETGPTSISVDLTITNPPSPSTPTGTHPTPLCIHTTATSSTGSVETKSGAAAHSALAEHLETASGESLEWRLLQQNMS